MAGVDEGVDIVSQSDSYYQKTIDTLGSIMDLFSELSRLSE